MKSKQFTEAEMEIIKSKLFTEAEIKEINRRVAGGKRDFTGVFYARVKPKILELLNEWFPRKKELKKLVKSKRRKKCGIN